MAEYKDPCSDDGIYQDARAQQQAQTAINDLSLSLECVNHKYDELIARKPTETEKKNMRPYNYSVVTSSTIECKQRLTPNYVLMTTQASPFDWHGQSARPQNIKIGCR